MFFLADVKKLSDELDNCMQSRVALLCYKGERIGVRTYKYDIATQTFRYKDASVKSVDNTNPLVKSLFNNFEKFFKSLELTCTVTERVENGLKYTNTNYLTQAEVDGDITVYDYNTTEELTVDLEWFFKLYNYSLKLV